MNAGTESGLYAIPDALVDRLRRAARVVVLTGAGISAESGLPTFRDPLTGLWAKYDPARLASRDGFAADPVLVWRWYEHRRAQALAAAPNPGHVALRDLERRVEAFDLITQNVDGLHQRAGSTRIIELHGNIFQNKCFEEDAPITLEECGPRRAANVPSMRRSRSAGSRLVRRAPPGRSV